MSRNTSTYGISRVDNDVSRTHGWLVTIQRRGVIHRRHFSDGMHGGKQKSYSAAKVFRDEIIAKYPPFSMREYSSIVKKSNRSGVVGVCRYCASDTRDLPDEEQRWFWVASWPMPSGKRKRVKFAVNKYGEEGAFKLALKARKEAMKHLEGEFDPGAVRRKPQRKSAKPNGHTVANGRSHAKLASTKTNGVKANGLRAGAKTAATKAAGVSSRAPSHKPSRVASKAAGSERIRLH